MASPKLAEPPIGVTQQNTSEQTKSDRYISERRAWVFLCPIAAVAIPLILYWCLMIGGAALR